MAPTDGAQGAGGVGAARRSRERTRKERLAGWRRQRKETKRRSLVGKGGELLIRPLVDGANCCCFCHFNCWPVADEEPWARKASNKQQNFKISFLQINLVVKDQTTYHYTVTHVTGYMVTWVTCIVYKFFSNERMGYTGYIGTHGLHGLHRLHIVKMNPIMSHI